MNQHQETTRPEKVSTPGQYTSIGLKLTLISVGMLLFGFIIYSIISVRIGQGSLLNNVKENMQKSTNDGASLIQKRLLETRSLAINFASILENGNFSEQEFKNSLQNIILNNEQVFGITAGYEPYQYQPEKEFWAPYYNTTRDGTLAFIDLSQFNYPQQGWYSLTKVSNAPLLLGPYLDPTRGDTWIFTWVVPIKDDAGSFIGAVAIDSEFEIIQDIFTNLIFGKTGYAFLIDTKGTILGTGQKDTELRPFTDSMTTIIDSGTATNWRELTNNMVRGDTGFMEVWDQNNVPLYIAYQPIGLNTGWSFATVYPREEVNQQTSQIQRTLTGYSLLLAFIFGFVIFYFTTTAIQPLRQLTKVAEEITDGNLDIVANIKSHDEVGILAVAMNRMTAQLRDTLDNLEMRITERTVDLEISRRQTEERAKQLIAIGEISKIINSEQKIDVLLPLITQLASERLNFYHTGIFLIDETKQYAVLHASNSTGGQIMLQRGHRLKIGESGIVGYVANSGTPRIALDVGQDAVFFNNPDLPNTRSEMALPLTAREKIIGVLDVQSDKPGAFTQEDISILNILADQVAIAIENSKLFEQTQAALDEARIAYQQNIREGWQNFILEESAIGYQQGISNSKKLAKPFNSDEINQAMHRGESLVFHADGKTDKPTMVIPIKLREQIIGVIHVKAPSEERQWTSSEINLTETVSERLSLALENARLIQESQRQAIKEQTIGEITTRISSSTNLENVLLTAVEELGRNIPGSEISIKLKKNENTGKKADKE